MRRLSHLELVWISTHQGIRSEYKKPVRELNYLKELYGLQLRLEITYLFIHLYEFWQLTRLVILHLFQSGDTHVLSIFDEEAQAVASVRRSSRLLEESFATGVAVLSKYSEQRDHLKVTILNSLLDAQV